MKIQLFRALFPRWDFFDKIGHRFDLEFKTEGSNSWNDIEFSQKRTPLGFFLNPETNLAMAQVNIIEHFVSDLQDSPQEDPQNFTSYKLLSALVKQKLTAYEFNSTSVQFRVIARKNELKEAIFYSNFFKVKIQ